MQVRDAGNLLTRAGLMIPSVDVDEVTVNYDTIDSLVHHLRYASPQYLHMGVNFTTVIFHQKLRDCSSVRFTKA